MTRTTLYTLVLLAWGISPYTPLQAAPRGSYYDQDASIALNETRDSVDAIRHQVENQETELRAFEHRVESLDTILESLRDQLQESVSAQKEQLKGNSKSLEMKIASLENSAKSLSADIKQLQTHANDTATALQSFKQKMAEWDQRIAEQSQNTEHLQTAMQSLMDAFQLKADLGSSSGSQLSGWTGRTYKVKSGDTLEKIARSQGSTITAIKEANSMSSDKIVVGKTLKIPN